MTDRRAWGIDISSHKCDYFGGPAPRMGEVKRAGCSFVISKVTDGENYVDSIWAEIQEQVRKNDMALGGFHYWQPTADPVKQARAFRYHFDFKAGDLPPVVDVEEENGADYPSALDNLMTHLEAVESMFGVRPLIYTGVAYWNRLMRQSQLGNPPTWCKNYDLWLSLPNGGNDPDLFPSGWDKRWRIWQCSWTGRVPGVQNGEGDVDMNWFNGTPAELAAWLAEVNPTRGQRVSKLFAQGKVGAAVEALWAAN